MVGGTSVWSSSWWWKCWSLTSQNSLSRSLSCWRLCTRCEFRDTFRNLFYVSWLPCLVTSFGSSLHLCTSNYLCLSRRWWTSLKFLECCDTLLLFKNCDHVNSLCLAFLETVRVKSVARCKVDDPLTSNCSFCCELRNFW